MNATAARRLIDDAVRRREQNSRWCPGCSRHLPPDAFTKHSTSSCATCANYRTRAAYRKRAAA